MKVQRHRLIGDDGQPVRFETSPNRGGVFTPNYLIMHYTAGSSAQGALNHMLNPSAKASAHILIGRDGAITQLVPFNRIAWHAGRSRWQGLEGMNRHSIGIELDNAGKLERQGGQWRAWFGRSYPDTEVMVARHMNEEVERGWQLYPEVQLAAAVEVARAIVGHYRLRDVLGHDDIAPGRKQDPGPAFPMDNFRASLIGRFDDEPERFVTRTALNIREGPGTGHAKLRDEPLSRGAVLVLQSRQGNWCFVEVLDGDDQPDLTGWVHGDYIHPL